ncbi:hypothetical protein DCS_05881 [Drechmeria coniospora]|uniref:Uncharacterized protein n=1 Tax=Drechmeria coniospora TaxID=98403 RepID=A0A151GP40_DRECN|nr:hypothetical protein DCS_05881 [Drechmeria coniospora]KYK58863.1 hypothetical protein DCS_05881 [Drechmeria coniospora]
MATSPDDRVLQYPESDVVALILESLSLERHPGIVRLSNRYLAKAYDPASAKDTLEASILKMRSVTSKTACSFVTGKCRSSWLDDYFGLPPRSMPKDISAFLAFRVDFLSIRQEF